MDDVTQRLYAWLLKRSAKSSTQRLRVAGLIQAAAGALDIDVVNLRSAFRDLRAASQLTYDPDLAGLPYCGYVTICLPALTESPAAIAWRVALEGVDIRTELREPLLPAHTLFADIANEDLALIAQALASLKSSDPRKFSYSLSAQHVLGSSKVLDRLPMSARYALGIVEHPSTPRYVVVAGPPNPCAVLLIENTTSYEEAVRAGLDEHMTLIAAYGYGLNMMSDSTAGWALVESLTGGRCEVLSRSGRDHPLAQLLQHPKLFFWGDLDREGMRIGLALRSRFTQLALSALYRPMCDMVDQRESSHPYAAVFGKANQAIWRDVEDVTFNALAAKCAWRAVDQEAVDLLLCGYLARESLVL